MIFLIVTLLSMLFSLLDLLFLKNFQLSGYKIPIYLKNIIHFNYSFGRKTPLKFTKRAKRQILIDFFAKFTSFFLVFWFCKNFWLTFSIVVAFCLFSPYLMIFSFLLALPIENCIKKFYIAKAKRKLANLSCKIIAITGSYGKTSTKHFLTQILSGKFSVCASRQSYNTEMGVCKTILEDLKNSDEILILEFGARKSGDIQKLCDIVGGVDHAIITPIGNCHIQTFKTQENLEQTKFELCKNTRDMVVFNGKSEGSKRLFDQFSGKKILCATTKSECYASDVKISKNSSLFDFNLREKHATCNCQVLGRGSIDNIVTAATLASVLGLNFDEICKKITSLKSPEHRLQLLPGGVATVIDDSYNSNFAGFCEALDVLSQFEGRKIVISPGFVELGKEQFEQNRKIAARVAEVADVFVIMNKTNKKALLSGINGGCEVVFANTREEQKSLLKKILKAGDVVLFENDLPDNIK